MSKENEIRNVVAELREVKEEFDDVARKLKSAGRQAEKLGVNILGHMEVYILNYIKGGIGGSFEDSIDEYIEELLAAIDER